MREVRPRPTVQLSLRAIDALTPLRTVDDLELEFKGVKNLRTLDLFKLGSHGWLAGPTAPTKQLAEARSLALGGNAEERGEHCQCHSERKDGAADDVFPETSEDLNLARNERYA